jgi:hypothetical protein
LALTTPASGGRAVGVVRSWTKATEFVYLKSSEVFEVASIFWGNQLLTEF